MVRHQFQLDLSGTPEISFSFQWYAINFIWISMVRQKFHLDFSGTPEISFGFQWYARNFILISMVRHKFHLSSGIFPKDDSLGVLLKYVMWVCASVSVGV